MRIIKIFGDEEELSDVIFFVSFIGLLTFFFIGFWLSSDSYVNKGIELCNNLAQIKLNLYGYDCGFDMYENVCFCHNQKNDLSEIITEDDTIRFVMNQKYVSSQCKMSFLSMGCEG